MIEHSGYGETEKLLEIERVVREARKRNGPPKFSPDKHTEEERNRIIREWIKRKQSAETTTPYEEERPSKPVAQSIVQKTVQLFRTVSGPKVSQEVFKDRLDTCMSCEYRKTKGERHFCGRCGCPSWKIAELNTKLWYARLECPEGKFDAHGT